jgi:hypothetical protein
MGNLRKTLRAAEQKHRIAGGRKHHQLWATEIWWESDPPDKARGVPLQKHARYLEESLYLLWKAGTKVVINLLLTDPPHDPQHPLATVEAGLYFADGRPKPALTAWEFPFVTDRASKRTVRAWGMAPRGGRLAIETRRKGGWRKLASKRVNAHRVFTARLHLRGHATVRASVGGEHSLPWRTR